MLEFSHTYGSMLVAGIGETLYMTLASALLAYLIGLPLGVLLAVTGAEGIRPLKTLNTVLGFIVNVLRSVPFLILLILVIPITRAIMGTSLGASATIVPLTIAAAPFVARLVESSLAEVDTGVVEAAWSMGASPLEIIAKVLLPEARSSLLLGATIAAITILGYSAMSGIVGGGGLGDIAIKYGYYRYETSVMVASVVLLVIIVMVLQALGDRWARSVDKKTVTGSLGFGFFGSTAIFNRRRDTEADTL
ncbi:MAG: ABC transporter permease [Actinomycetia bacterium]|nr:ABC transporter permease [Actinomycetes bacterium]